MKSLRIGICGWGNVATGLFKTINQNKELIKSKGKLDIEISVIGARRKNQNDERYHGWLAAAARL